MKTVAFMPLKLSNERLPGKNTRNISPNKPLYRLMLDSLVRSGVFDEIYIFCSSEKELARPPQVQYLRRDRRLDRSQTLISEVIEDFSSQVESDVFFMAHATAPFMSSMTIRSMVEAVTSEEYDSSMSVLKLREFFWSNNSPLNFSHEHIPRTQDLDPYFVETTGAYCFRAELAHLGKRTGEKPKLVEVSKVEAVDINDDEDWLFAEAIYNYALWPLRPEEYSSELHVKGEDNAT